MTAAQNAARDAISATSLERAFAGGSLPDAQLLADVAADAFSAALLGATEPGARAAAANDGGLLGVLGDALADGAAANPLCISPEDL